MRSFRFSILQLLLAATLAALVMGLVTSAWRASKYQSIVQVVFSPNGKHLAALYSGGAVQIWRFDKDGPRLVARAFGQPGLLSFACGSRIHYISDSNLLKVQSDWMSRRDTHVQQLDVRSRQVTDVVTIDSAYPTWYSHAVSVERLVLCDWNANTIFSYSLKTGRLERSRPLAFVAPDR